MNNPHEAIRPNFNADCHEQERLALVENGLTAEQAIQTLEHLWNLNNDREKEAWDRRLAEAAQADAQAAREVEEDAARRRREEEEDADLARREDKKKHKSKYASIPDVMVPSDLILIPSSYALKKLRNHEFVELFFFTNKGLAEAEKAGLEDESFVLVKDGESHTWVSATSARTGKQRLTRDEDLTWEEFLEATPCIVSFMRQTGWAEEHVDMLILFWSRLQMHDWRFSRDEFSKQALLVYQGQQRKRWHLAIGSSSAWSLALINKTVLKKTKDLLFDEARVAELAKLSKVRLLFIFFLFDSSLIFFGSFLSVP
ncbi:hypothetical protein AX14_001564 [Amanita brunnescens Koide BX004]|nr:hypothetical protein AX14_001564 [Amanita brunnescens Koide BX004]